MNIIIISIYMKNLFGATVAMNQVFEPRHPGPTAGPLEAGCRVRTAPRPVFLRDSCKQDIVTTIIKALMQMLEEAL